MDVLNGKLEKIKEIFEMENADVFKKSIESLLKETDDINFQIRMLRHKNQELTGENDKQINSLQEGLEKVEFQIKEAF
jgi:regulator of replication initiation timing